MSVPFSRSALACGIAAGALLAPALAAAQTVSTAPAASTEARLQALEAELASLRAQVEAQRVAASQPATIDPARIEALERRAAEPVPEGFRVGSTTIKMSGFVKVDGIFSDFRDGAFPATVPGGTSAREFYVPGATPVGGTGEGVRFNGHGKQTRLILTMTPAIQGHTATGYVEMDFQSAPGSQGTQNVSNAYDLSVRRAYFTLDGFLFGQDWTTFQNTAILPETADFIGVTDGTVFGRQPMVRYTRKFSDALTMQLALENPETITLGVAGGPAGAQDDDVVPDAVVSFNITQPFGALAVAGLLRNLSVDNPGYDESTLGWGLSVSGKIPLGAPNRHDLRFSLTAGDGIGRYVGLATLPDAVAGFSGVDPDLEAVSVLAGSVAARFVLSPKWRTNVGYAFQDGDLDAAVVPGTTTESTSSLFLNLFYSPVPGTDLGIELRRGTRSLVSGAEGELDRVHFVAKRGF
jgi:hypothetical protein